MTHPPSTFLPRQDEIAAAVRGAFDRHVVARALEIADTWAASWQNQGKTQLADTILNTAREEACAIFDRKSTNAEDSDNWDEVAELEAILARRGWEFA